MARIQVNDVWVAVIQTRQQDQVGLCVTHWACTGQVGLGGSDVVFASILDGRITADFLQNMQSNASYEQTSVSRVRPLPPTKPVIDSTSAAAGTDATDRLPKQVSGLLTKNTAFGGPRYRGRLYMPFPSEGFNDVDGRPNGAYTGRLQTWGTQYFQGMTVTSGADTSSLVPIIYHRDTNTWDVVTSVLVRGRWATQRRRGDFGRPN